MTRLRDRPKPLFPVTAVTETASETVITVLAATETDAETEANTPVLNFI